MIRRLRTYLPEAWAELKKVAWPTRQTVVNLTLIVIAVSVAVGAYIAIIDVPDRGARPGAVMTDETREYHHDRRADDRRPRHDVDAVIEAEATDDTEDLDEPQASEVAAADVDTVEEGEVEIAEAVEDDRRRATHGITRRGAFPHARSGRAAEEAAAEAEESQAGR